ncbi:MAG: LPS export ABC transporter periplasmic protein LptC [Gemmatimonas sp.]|nr:LPS export ABC transporter periplasmic protein LptC [Gemmatimonas sp.]
MRWLVLPLVAVLAAGCGREATTPSATSEAFDLPADKVADSIRHVITKDGVRSADLRSDTAYIYDSERTFDLRGVRVTFYSETGAEAGELTSKLGDYNMETGRFVAREDVVLIAEGVNGERRLETEQLIYDVRTDSLSSNRPFTLYEGGRVSRGTSFRSDTQFRTWEVMGAQTEAIVGESGDVPF